jgi:hypothetical protein
VLNMGTLVWAFVLALLLTHPMTQAGFDPTAEPQSALL